MSNNVGPAFDQVLQSAVSANNTGGTQPVGGMAGATVTVTGTFTATVTPKGAGEDGNYFGLQAYNLTTGAWVSSITAAGAYWVPFPGIATFQCPVTWTSGTSVTVTSKAVEYASGPMPAVSAAQLVKLTDGTNTEPMASAANLTASPAGNGAAIQTRPGEWAASSNPGVNAQASASQAAGGAGVRHVCTSVSFSVASDATAPAATQLVVNLRDGATGAGTVKESWTVAIPAAAGAFASFGLSGLNIVGSANTAMTLEFAAAGGAHTYEACNIAGYDVS